MAGEPLGRPKTLVRRHVIEIKQDTQEFLHDELEGLRGAFLAGKGIGATGEALEGFLSNPTGALLVGGGVLAAIGAWVGLDGVEIVTEFFTSLQGLMAAEQGGPEQQEAADTFIEAQKALIRFFTGGLLNPFLGELGGEASSGELRRRGTGEQVEPPPEGGE